MPAAVTIAQAIEESGWGQSSLATQDNNLFGIKGSGPAGSDAQPTQEFLNGGWVNTTAGFAVYRNVAESINDHGRLLATSGYYTGAMAVRHSPNAFADALTGVYATDPGYGSKIIGLMRQYNLYRYDVAGRAPSRAGQPAPAGGTDGVAGTAAAGRASIPGLPGSPPGPVSPPAPHRKPARPTPPAPSPPARPTPVPSSPGPSTPGPGSAHARRQHACARRTYTGPDWPDPGARAGHVVPGDSAAGRAHAVEWPANGRRRSAHPGDRHARSWT